MKKSKKFVLAGLVLLAAITGLLALTGCKTDVDTSSPQQDQPGDSNTNSTGTGGGESTETNDTITTSDPAAEAIAAITTEGTYTIEVQGNPDMTAVANALKDLASRLSGTRIHLDLSQSGITSIGDRVFSNCTSLASVEIPSSVTSIGDSAFDGCSSLASVIFAEGSRLEIIWYSAFNGCSSLDSVEIPSSVTSIGDMVFFGCSSLDSVTFQDGSQLASIGILAFRGCSNLDSVEIPSSVTSIGDMAFRGCRGLDSVTFQAGSQLEIIGNYAFYECSELSTVKVEAETPPSLGTNVFDATAADLKIQVPSSFVSDYLIAEDWSAYEDKIVAITP